MCLVGVGSRLAERNSKTGADRFISAAGKHEDVTDTLDPEAVFWDIGGVIVQLESIQSGHQDFVDSLLDSYQSPLPPADALKTWRSMLGEYFRGGEGTEYRTAREGYRQATDAILSGDVEETEWKPLFQRIHDEHATPHPDAIETIERLAESDLHLGVISDVDDEEGKRLLDAFGVRGHFDSFTSSEAVGFKKPDQAMFETALRKADVDPGTAVMIGDRYENDMLGASEAGMVTVGYGTEEGPAVDYRVDDLREILELLGLSDPPSS